MQLTPSDSLASQFPAEIQIIDTYNQQRNSMARGPKPEILLMASTMRRLSDIYETEKKKVAQFHEEIDAKYSTDDAIDIENMVSYMENVQYGFGHRNDEACFEVAKRNDLLYQEALHWMDVARDYRFLQRIVLHYRAQIRT
jgi:hypothetical protein